MEIKNAFTVNASLEQTWNTLLDVPSIVPCMPGARLTDVEGDVYHGRVKIKVGPVTTEYGGTAQFVERDYDRHRARIEARGRETRGAGTASAIIDTILETDGTSTTVTVTTDLTITGKVAQFGRGMIEEISQRLIGQFASNLEIRLQAPPGLAATSPPEASASDQIDLVAKGAASQQIIDDTPLDVLAVARGAVIKRLVPLLVCIGVLALLTGLSHRIWRRADS